MKWPKFTDVHKGKFCGESGSGSEFIMEERVWFKIKDTLGQGRWCAKKPNGWGRSMWEECAKDSKQICIGESKSGLEKNAEFQKLKFYKKLSGH